MTNVLASRQGGALLPAVVCLLAGCLDSAGPAQPGATETTAIPAALTARASAIGGNAVYQVRKESGASAYDLASNTTFITYNGRGMDIYVRAYANASATWGPLTLAKTWTHYAGGTQWAYHDYSAIVLGPDDKLHVFQADHGHALYELVAPTAHSVAGAWTERLVSSDHNTYPSVNVVGNSIYVIYVRDYAGTPDTYRTLKFIKRDWNGSGWSAWSSPRTIIDTRRMMGTKAGVGDLYDEVYQQSVSLFDDKLWITFHLAGGATSCPANAKGHNCGAKDLYLVGLDVRNPWAPGHLYSAGMTDLGATVTCASLGKCPELLNIGTGARVASFPADPQSSDWGLSHPVSFSMAGWSPGTGTWFVAYNLGSVGDDNAVKLARFSSGPWKHMTLDRGIGFSLRDIAMTQSGSIELAYLTGAPTRARSRLVTYSGTWPAAVATLYPDLAVPMIGTPVPDKISFLQIVATKETASRPFKMFGTTFNYAMRQIDYTGDWNGFGLYYR